jgi:hypothetical protein
MCGGKLLRRQVIVLSTTDLLLMHYSHFRENEWKRVVGEQMKKH